MKAFLVDDEELALKRLKRLLEATGRIEVIGMRTDPLHAIQAIATTPPELLFLDIEMPGLSGFEMLAQLNPQPLTVFTTAYDRYALQAFGVNSIDYLLKPVEASQLERVLSKIDRIRAGAEPRPEWRDLLAQLSPYPERVSSRVGDRVEFVDLSRVSHFFAQDKLTYAATPAKNYCVDYTIQQLEQRLDPRRFVRIHRATLVNIGFVQELHTWFGGRYLIRLKDEKRTEITVARDRVRVLREKLGL